MSKHSEQPADPVAFTASFDRAYTRFAGIYDVAVRMLPLWRTWLRRALPHLRGPRVLEVSFGTGYLMTQYAERFEVHGVDLNERMVTLARANLERAGKTAALCRGTVEALPYREGSFDSVLNTMAFSGYPDADSALRELLRVLKPGGHLVLVDVNYPGDGNLLGTWVTAVWKRSGDLIRDLNALFDRFSVEHEDQEIGGWGSVHLYRATRAARIPDARADAGDDS